MPKNNMKLPRRIITHIPDDLLENYRLKLDLSSLLRSTPPSPRYPRLIVRTGPWQQPPPAGGSGNGGQCDDDDDDDDDNDDDEPKGDTPKPDASQQTLRLDLEDLFRQIFDNLTKVGAQIQLVRATMDEEPTLASVHADTNVEDSESDAETSRVGEEEVDNGQERSERWMRTLVVEAWKQVVVSGDFGL